MPAAGDAPAGLFSGVWSRIHSAASVWRRRGRASGNGDGGDREENDAEEEEEAVRSRLARRAAAARRLGRKLAFVSFNLEVLVFVYAFWRARRRSLSWRLPTQALPILVVPALATLIYAAFVRFTRTLDLKDKKRLERLQEDKQQTDGEPRELDQDEQNNVQNCDGVDDASNSSLATDSVPHTPRLRKRRQPSMNKRDDGAADMAWGHSKDFQSMPSDGLRHRTFSSGKTYMTNSSATESSEQYTQKTRSFSAYSDQHVHVPICTEDTVSYPSDDHSGSAISSMLAQPANTPHELPAGDGEKEEEFDGSWGIMDTCSSSRKENLVSPAGPHNSFCDRHDSRSSEHALSSLSTAFQELLVKVDEEHLLSLPEKLESSPVFMEEAAASPPDGFVSRSCLNDLSPDLSDPVPPASETLKELPAEGIKEKALVEPPPTSAALQMYSFTSEDNPTWCAVDDKELKISSDVETYLLPPIRSDVQDNAAVVNIDAVNPKWNLLLKLYGNEVEETKLSKFHIPEESTRPKSCLGIPEFSLCSKVTKKLEIVVEGSEDDIEEESCELNTNKENAILINMEEDDLQDPLTVSTSTREQCLEASDVSSCIQDAKAREVSGTINFVTTNPELMDLPPLEVLAEDDEEFKEDKTSDLHLPENNGVSLSFEEEPILDSPVADTAEHLLVTPLYTEEVEITEVHDVVKEGCFESEDEEAFNHRKLAPSNDDSNTRNLTSDSIRVQFIPNTDITEALEGGQEASSEPLHESTYHAEETFLSSGETSNDEVYSSDSNSYAKMLEGLSKFQEEMPITSSDSPIFLDEVKSAAIVDSDAASPKLSLQTDLHGGEVEENESCKYHVPEEIRTPFSLEEEVLLSPPAVNDGSLFRQLKFICQSAGTPEFSLCNQESEGMEVAGSVSFIENSPELSFLSSPELGAEGGEDAREKEVGGLNTEEANTPLINLEDEALQGELVVSTMDQSLETSEFSLSSQGANMTEVPGIVSSFTVSPELSYPAFPELLAEGDEDLKEDETSDLLLHEQKGLPFNLEEPFLEPVVVDTAEDAVVTSELLICSEEVKMTEVHGVVKEVFSESEDEGAFDHRKLAPTSPDDDNTAQNLTNNSIYAQFIPDASEASQAGQEPLFETPHESTSHYEGTFLSSGEINHDEVKFEAPFAGQEVGGSVSFIEASPELSFLSSPELVAAGGEDAREKAAGELNMEEENVTLINLEDEALQGELVVSTANHSLETSEFSLSSQGTKMTEVPEIVSSFTVSPEMKYPAFPELLVEGDEDLKEDEMSDLPMHEQKGLPYNLDDPFRDPLVVDTAEDALVTSELLICSEEVKMTEVHGVVKEVLSASEDEGAFDHRKLVLTSPDDDGTTQTLISNSISAQFIPDASIKEASQAGYEELLEPLHESTCQSEGAFSSSGEIDEVKAEAPFAGQEGLPNSDDEMALTRLDTSILLDEVRSAENSTDNSGSSQSIHDSNQIQSLHDHEQAPSETSQEVTSLLEGSHTSSDEGINSEIFSLYSRSSSCVSEINILETLRGGTSSELQSDRGISLDESNPVTFPNMDSTESNTNNPVTAEFVLETNMIETPNAAEEATAGSPPEVSSNFLGTFVAPDVINGMTESDKHLDLSSSSFAPVIDAFESLETGQGFSELQSEIDFAVQETSMSPNEVSNAENSFTDTVGYPQDSERTTFVPLVDEDLTLHRAYMSPEDVSDDQNSLADDYASDLPQMVESHCVSEKLSPESQDPLSSEEILVYPDEGSNAEPWGDPQDREDEDLTLHRAYVSPEDTSDVENSLADDYASDLPHTVELSPESQDPLSSQDLFYPDIAYSPLCSTEVNLAESWSSDQEGTQQYDETMLGSEDIYMVDLEANSENLGNNSGSLDIPDATMMDSLRGAEIVSSEILYDGMSSFEGTLLSLDGEDNAEEDSPNNSGSVTHTAQINTTSLLGLQEGSFKQEDEMAINSTSPYDVDTEETTYSSVFAKDKEPKEASESKDMKEDVEDSEDDHENNPIATFGVDEITAALAPKPAVELYANDVSSRDSATWISNDLDMAVRKPVVTISDSNGSSTMSELADVQYTGSVDGDTETLGAPLPSSVASE